MLQRLSKESIDLEKNPEKSCPEVDLFDETDMSKWKLTIQGPPDTPWEGGKFIVALTFPQEYPFKCPDIQF